MDRQRQRAQKQPAERRSTVADFVRDIQQFLCCVFVFEKKGSVVTGEIVHNTGQAIVFESVDVAEVATYIANTLKEPNSMGPIVKEYVKAFRDQQMLDVLHKHEQTVKLLVQGKRESTAQFFEKLL